MSRHARDWTAWHLHPGTAELELMNRTVLDVLAPAVASITAELGSRTWYFLRYWQGGPHLRLRVRDMPEELVDGFTTELADRLRTIEAAIPDGRRLDDDTYRATAVAIAAAGEGSGPMPVEPFRPPGVYRATYEPEYDRYGGRDLIGLSESLFHQSSRLTVALLRDHLASSESAYPAVGLNVLTAGVAALGTDLGRLARFAGRARDRWARFTASTMFTGIDPELFASAGASGVVLAQRCTGLLELIRSPRGALGTWTVALREAMDRWRDRPDPDGILLSQLHMACNRLGIGPPGETHLWATLGALFTEAERMSAG